MEDTHRLNVWIIQMATASGHEDKMVIDHPAEVEEEAVKDTPPTPPGMVQWWSWQWQRLRGNWTIFIPSSLAAALDAAPVTKAREQHHFDQIDKDPEW
jgi:hypothetical protein